MNTQLSLVCVCVLCLDAAPWLQSCKWDALISLPSTTFDCHAVSILAK